ncbi:flagellar biosynthetic protein FliO [Cohnella sp. AR92]|uniref:flagellar biosynthetic protein FliO n=1 Tax=Cohnella sp. AR92 TaxID=648716 RepID=UPI000F8E9AB2|nr:flagellar biosynthetic protein FliO [Cohnella sp. AR92]RUS46363.1 flagellar protein [Cohnella sp. AR92]
MRSPAASLLAAGNENLGTSGWDMFRILLVLGLIVALIIFVLRFIGKKNRGWWINRSLRSLGGVAVGTNKSLQIVEWNGRIYVLGVGENVSLLEVISDTDTVAALLAEHDTVNSSSDAAIPAWLKRLGNRSKPGEARSEEPVSGGVSFEQTLEARMRELSERRQKVDQLLNKDRSGDRTDD